MAMFGVVLLCAGVTGHVFRVFLYVVRLDVCNDASHGYLVSDVICRIYAAALVGLAPIPNRRLHDLVQRGFHAHWCEWNLSDPGAGGVENCVGERTRN